MFLSTGAAVFLDRDGTINRKSPEGSYVTEPDLVELLPRSALAVRQLNDLGLPVIVVTNQRGIALGLMTEEQLRAVHERLRYLLDKDCGARLDAIYHCPHERFVCRCRKPGIGLFERAVADRPGLDLRGSVMIGDAVSDVAAGRAAGMRTILLGPSGPDLKDAVDRVLAHDAAR